jgi:cytochrome c oxidase subunit 2
VGARRESDSTTENEATPKRERRIIVRGGVLTVLSLIIMCIFALKTMEALAASDVSDNYVVEVVGRQWWGEVYYPNQVVTTTSEIHLTVSEAVTLQVTSVDAIHSFWIPQLHGQIEITSDQTNIIWIKADKLESYYDEYVESCDSQQAKMTFILVTEPMEQLTSRLEQQHLPAVTPADSLALEGRQGFLEAECIQCHILKDVETAGILGSDLAHLAADTLPNSQEHLGGWIVSPQKLKSGSLIPSTKLTGSELQVLLTYLENLK